MREVEEEFSDTSLEWEDTDEIGKDKRSSERLVLEEGKDQGKEEEGWQKERNVNVRTNSEACGDFLEGEVLVVNDLINLEDLEDRSGMVDQDGVKKKKVIKAVGEDGKEEFSYTGYEWEDIDEIGKEEQILEKQIL